MIRDPHDPKKKNPLPERLVLHIKINAQGANDVDDAAAM
jgi:hypothetical protein